MLILDVSSRFTDSTCSEVPIITNDYRPAEVSICNAEELGKITEISSEMNEDILNMSISKAKSEAS